MLRILSWFILEQPIEVSSEQILFFKFIEHNSSTSQKMHHRIIVKVK